MNLYLPLWVLWRIQCYCQFHEHDDVHGHVHPLTHYDPHHRPHNFDWSYFQVSRLSGPETRIYLMSVLDKWKCSSTIKTMKSYNWDGVNLKMNLLLPGDFWQRRGVESGSKKEGGEVAGEAGQSCRQVWDRINK